MKILRSSRIVLIFLIVTIAHPTVAQLIDIKSVKRCGTAEHERVLQARDPFRYDRIKLFNSLINKTVENNRSARQSITNDIIYRIPIVVHVIHDNPSGQIGGSLNKNISDDQIISQIGVLNEDYRRILGTRGYNTDSLSADTSIEFFLAQTDPQGNPTNGITRHYYANKSSFRVSSGTDDMLLAQIAYWPSDRYLNIWVADLEDNYLGYTQFPAAADTLSGLPPGGVSELIDGTIINYRAFGRGSNYSLYGQYNLGRTLTHEIGHWLGLLHPNGDSPCGDDYVNDTPPTDNLNQTTSCADIYALCSGKRYKEMIANYMMYSPDACMNIFTKGQKERMRAVLQISPRRSFLIKSQDSLAETDNLTLTLSPNPTASDPTAEIQFKGLQSFVLNLLTSTGQKIYSSHYSNIPSTRVTIPINKLSPGVYIVYIYTDREKVARRLLIK